MSFREASVADDDVHSLIAEYFASRAAGFPPELGTYTPVFPPPMQFLGTAGVFLVVGDASLEPADCGCGGIRRIPSGATDRVRFEVKHLWIQPRARGRGHGRALLVELEHRARDLGATELVLDTNWSVAAAAALYRSSGFTEISPYNDNRNATNWLGKSLARG